MTVRPELTSLIPADPRIASLPQGNVIVHRDGDRLRIEHADPRVVISFQLLDAIVRGDGHPDVTITAAPGAAGWQDAVIRINAANRTLVYRLTECLGWYCGWIMEWPD